MKICLVTNECQFDLQTTQEFTDEVKKSQNVIKFIQFLRQDRQRVEIHFDMQLTEL